MPDAVTCSPLRAPADRFSGVFRDVPVEALAATVIRELVTRNGLEASLIHEVVLGTSTPTARVSPWAIPSGRRAAGSSPPCVESSSVAMPDGAWRRCASAAGRGLAANFERVWPRRARMARLPRAVVSAGPTMLSS